MEEELKLKSDEELARQTQGGSLAAFEELVARYERRVYGFVRQWRRDDTEARELTQDTFVRAFQAISQLNCQLVFAPWLFSIARRKCINAYRAKLKFSDEPPPEQTDFNDPAELMARDEDRENTWRMARKHLSDTQFQAIWLRYVEEMNIPGVARALGKSQIAVRVLLFRARQTLAAKLADTPARKERMTYETVD